MGRKILLILCVLALILAPISAVDTEITIKTIPDYKIAPISFIVPGSTYSVIESFHYTANKEGEAKFVFTTSRDDFDIKIWLKLDGETMLVKRYNDTFDAGTPLVLEAYPDWYVSTTTEAKNETINETNETEAANETVENITEAIATATEEPEEKTTQIEDVKSNRERVTAFSVQDGKLAISAKGFLYLFGLVILAVLIFIGIKHSHNIEKAFKGNKKKDIKIIKAGEINKNKSEKLKDQEEKIDKAKSMIEDAQKEIDKMKNPNQSKIDEIKRRLIEDEKELMKLRKSE